jgi:hypothetical protein
MPISLVCPNGHKLVAKESLAGKNIKCPKCSSILLVSDSDESDLIASELVEDLGAEGSISTEPSWLAEDLPFHIPTPIDPPHPSAPQEKTPAAPSAKPSKISPKVLIIAYSAIGSVLAISLLSVIASMAFDVRKSISQNQSGNSGTSNAATPAETRANPSEPTQAKASPSEKQPEKQPENKLEAKPALATPPASLTS